MSILARIERLEKFRFSQSPNPVLHCRYHDLNSGPMRDDLHVWQEGYYTRGLNPASGPISAFKGKFMLIPTFNNMAEWEKGAAIQQTQLLEVCRSKF